MNDPNEAMTQTRSERKRAYSQEIDGPVEQNDGGSGPASAVVEATKKRPKLDVVGESVAQQSGTASAAPISAGVAAAAAVAQAASAPAVSNSVTHAQSICAAPNAASASILSSQPLPQPQTTLPHQPQMSATTGIAQAQKSTPHAQIILSGPTATSVPSVNAPNTSSNISSNNNAANKPIVAPPRKDSPPPPLKSFTFHHLHKKYSSELDYMLLEFKKLERQLLGAPPIQQQQQNKSNNPNGMNKQSEPKKVESAGSKERREKLQGFITHLEDTIRQISEGILVEKQEEMMGSKNNGDIGNGSVEGSSSAGLKQPQHEEEKKSSETSIIDAKLKFTADFTAEQASLSNLPPEKEKEESVQRLEEHILANLLPVKVRLTRQLAAQKGATKNPVTAPLSARHGHLRNAGVNGVGGSGGTIAEEAEAKRKAILFQQQQHQQQQHETSSASKVPLASSIAAPAATSAVATAATTVANPAASSKTTPSQYGRPLGQTGSSLTARLHGSVLGSSKAAPATNKPVVTAGAVASTTEQKTPLVSTTTPVAAAAVMNNIASPIKRRILYAGIAPGSSQVPSSINAVSGVHPGLVNEDAARAVAVAEDERRKLKRLEESAARVALGGQALPSGVDGLGAGTLLKSTPEAIADQNRKPAAIQTSATATISNHVPSSSLAQPISRTSATHATAALKSPPEGPATLAARARAHQAAMALAAASASTSSSKSRPNQRIPTIVKPSRPVGIAANITPSGVQLPPKTHTQQQTMQQQQRQKVSSVSQSNVSPSPAASQIHAQFIASDAAIPPPTANHPAKKSKPKKPHIPPNFNDPSLTPTQQFQLRLDEARRRQRKRRRARRRQRLEGRIHGVLNSTDMDHHGRVAAMQQHSQQTQALQHQQRILSAATAAHASSIAASRLKSGVKVGVGVGSIGLSAPACTTGISANAAVTAVAAQGKKLGIYGSRTIEYVCALCNEGYPSSCEMNPWWALSSQDCPKCGKTQVRLAMSFLWCLTYFSFMDCFYRFRPDSSRCWSLSFTRRFLA